MILNHFTSLQLTEKDKVLLANTFKEIHLKKGDLLLKSDTKVTYQYYVFSGCLRTFFMDDNGKDHTIQFAIKDWWTSDYTAYFSTSKSIMNIECIQDAIVYRISRQDTEKLYLEIPGLESFFRKKMENAFASFQKRILDSLYQTATTRYLNFISKYPNIEQNVKNYHVASYLGITKESLSRIRKDIPKT